MMIWKCIVVIATDLFCAEHDLQEDLNSVYSWLCANCSSLSVTKSHVMLIGSHQKLQKHGIHDDIYGKLISHVSSTKYLGY